MSETTSSDNTTLALPGGRQQQAVAPVAVVPTRSDKILAHHLDRMAIVYVRQSTQHQVLEHRESAARQYALTDRAADLGWHRDLTKSSTTIKVSVDRRLRDEAVFKDCLPRSVPIALVSCWG